MDKLNMSYYNYFLRAIKYVIDIKYYFYQIQPYRNINGTWEPQGYSEADYAGDNYTGKIVTGYVVLIK